MGFIKPTKLGQANNKGHIFISYRRDDSAGYTRAIYDQLVERFTEGRIFMDVDAIEPGLPFDEVINNAVGSCEVLLAIIGKHWLEQQPGTVPRISNEKDFVRLEIAAALARNVRVIPVLLDGAVMPTEESLPEPLRALARRNAIEISNTRFKSDSDRLIEVVAKVLGEPIQQPNKESSRSNKAMRYWLLGGLIAVALFSTITYHYYEKAQRLGREHKKEEQWLTGDQYQEAFDKRLENGFYPDRLEGRCENGYQRFHAEWKRIPPSTDFISHHGITKEIYDGKRQEYEPQGFSLESLQVLKDCAGLDKYQATWFKKNN